MATANKVNFGLKNVHYAVITYSSAGVPSWGAVKAVPGAVNLTLDRDTAKTVFHADDSKYFVTSVNNGFTGNLEMADFPVAMRQDLFGDTVTTTSKLLVENISAQPKEFALLFEVNGDQAPNRYCMYRCMATRPNVEASTVEDSIEVKTQSCELEVLPVVYPGNAIDGHVSYRTTEDTPSATYTSFYSSVLTTLS